MDSGLITKLRTDLDEKIFTDVASGAASERVGLKEGYGNDSCEIGPHWMQRGKFFLPYKPQLRARRTEVLPTFSLRAI